MQVPKQDRWLLFGDLKVELDYLDYRWSRYHRMCLFILTILCILHIYPAAAVTSRRGDRPIVIALLWVGAALYIACLLAMLASIRKSTFRYWTMDLVGIIVCIAEMFFIAGSVVCSYNTDYLPGDTAVQTCFDFNGNSAHIPLLPYGLVLLIPWLLPFAFMTPWFTAIPMAGVLAIAASTVVIVQPIALGYSIPGALLLLSNALVAFFGAYVFERGDRHMFRMYLFLARQMTLLKQQMRERRRAERKVAKLADFMDASEQTIFEIGVTYTQPNEEIMASEHLLALRMATSNEDLYEVSSPVAGR